jgi:ATP-dependent RNA helicase DDX5/DBP2
MENKQSTNLNCKSHTSDDNKESFKEDEHIEKRNSEQNLDLSSIPSNIVQTLHVCSNHKKPKKLIITLQRIYKKQNEVKVGRFTVNNWLSIVFFAQIKTLKYVSKLLIKEGLRCVELYGSLNQMEREKRLLEFKSGKTPILLATDIAARGIHVNNVNYVINYDFPSSLDQYVHRCGRAGRKEALKGATSQYPPTVYSFFTREYSAIAVSVVDLLKSCKAWIDPNLIALIEENKDEKKKRKRGDESTENATGAGEKEGDDDSDSDNNHFFFLLGIVVLRGLFVVSAADSSDDDDDDETT